MIATDKTPDTAPWPTAVVQEIAEIMGSTDSPGLANREIEQLLTAAGIPDVLDAPNKRSRLATALLHQQQRDGSSTGISRFLTEAMTPARYLRARDRFEQLRKALAERFPWSASRSPPKGDSDQQPKPPPLSTTSPASPAASATN